MLTTTLYNMNGEKVGEIELPEKIFGVPVNPDMVHFAAVVQSANGRQVLAHTKDRGEVSGAERSRGNKKAAADQGTAQPVLRSGATVALLSGRRRKEILAKRLTKK